MTIEQFLDLVSAGSWHLDVDGNLCDYDEDCPLWFAYKHLGYAYDDDELEREPVDDYIEAGRCIGLRTKTAEAIAAAADNHGDQVLRKRLLEAAGVEEGLKL